MLRKVIIAIVVILTLGLGSLYWWLQSKIPSTSGQLQVNGLKQQVEVRFDNYGVPHIYAQNGHDAYFSLGYVTARDRFFQLDLFRRLSSGRLSELFGNKTLKSDKFFRTLGLTEYAQNAAKEFERTATPELKELVNAYIAGINAYVKEGEKPLEFSLIGAEAETFKLEDVYLITGYLALGFAEGFRIDPLIENMYRTVGDVYMNELELGWPDGHTTIPVTGSKKLMGENFSNEITAMLEEFPVAPWHGSNAWVIAPQKTKAKSTILCNDAHMGFSQPGAWYEAHIEYPGFKHYGNYIAGMPFALTGHNDFCGNGLTMLENDDVDFFIEEVQGDKVKYKNEWTPIRYRNETIAVKDREPVNLKIGETPHGPLIQDVFDDFPVYQVPVSVFWTYLKFPSKAIEAVYGLNHARSMDEARNAASLIHAPGLNVVYGDKDGHIAWWAAAKFIKRPQGLMSKRFLNGADGQSEPLGYYSFNENPMSEDPSSGFVYTANNQPDSCAVGLYPGYYVPQDRALTISTQLKATDNWDVEACKKLMVTGKSEVYAKTAKHLLDILKTINADALFTEQANRLSSWEGEHGLEAIGPVIYYRWIYNILELALADQLGNTKFKAFMNTHFMKTSYPVFLNRSENLWWDNPLTRQKENRAVIVKQAWNKTIEDLSAQLGKDVNDWRWRRVHTLELEHPMGSQTILGWYFNTGPEPVPGGNEVVNNMGFSIDSSGKYPVKFGPSMRRIIDFSALEESYSVLPAGQSGYPFSKHYNNQFALFVSNTFRPQLMNRKKIESKSETPLILKP